MARVGGVLDVGICRRQVFRDAETAHVETAQVVLQRTDRSLDEVVQGLRGVETDANLPAWQRRPCTDCPGCTAYKRKKFGFMTLKFQWGRD